MSGPSPFTEDDRREARITFLLLAELLGEKRFGEADLYLSKFEASASEETPLMLISILTVTKHWKDQLPARERFVTGAERQLKKVLGDVRAERYLSTRR